MKKKIVDLQVDFIGDQAKPLAKEEELLISKYISDHKLKNKSKAKRSRERNKKKQTV